MGVGPARRAGGGGLGATGAGSGQGSRAAGSSILTQGSGRLGSG